MIHWDGPPALSLSVSVFYSLKFSARFLGYFIREWRYEKVRMSDLPELGERVIQSFILSSELYFLHSLKRASCHL